MKNLESIINIGVTSIFSLATIIITLYNANRQVKQSKEMFKQQAEQYEKEKLYNKEMVRIQKRPYLVFDGEKSSCECHGNGNHYMNLCFKNKGNGSAFNFEPEIEIIATNGNVIRRKEPIQDPIVMVNEVSETKWEFNSSKRNFEFSITVLYEDMSAQLYEQRFNLTLDDGLHMMVKNYAEPELV
ncbi:Uncharacterised protein [Anaerostipes hadrus]|uniref:Uncharacterized protein n=1 Tax=Anaerostipes hadrus TaxID=649756 RepID=A0A174UTH3_ANAHA|nr:hypothetical protein [Anaerostipes hadrus]CUQ23120.1 Uncharacterised protein [Anaerostipes hadrus]